MNVTRIGPGGVVLSRRQVLGAAGVALAGPALAACTGGDGEQAAGGSGPADRVTTMTGFGESAREIFQRVAVRKGFFEEANIEILSVEAGAGGDTNHTALAGGQVDFMIADASGAFIRYVNGTDRDFQILAAIQQLWPMALLGYADNGITSPRDLNGRKVGIAAGTIAEKLWPVYAEETPGLDAASVEVIPTDAQTQVGQLAAGQLDAIALFSVSAPGLEAAAQGRAVTALNYSAVLPDLFGNALITSKRLIGENPDLVGRFTGAVLRGLEWTLANPAEAGEIQAEEFPESGSPQVHAREIELLRDFCSGGLAPGQPLGHIDEQKVVRAMKELRDVGELTDDFNTVMTPPGGVGDEGVVNYLFVPGAPQQREVAS